MFAQQCKQMNISINAVFRKDRLNNQNAAPVHLRLTQNRKLKHISTGVTLNINEWDCEYLKQTIERLETLGKYGSASKHRSLLSRLSQFRSLNI